MPPLRLKNYNNFCHFLKKFGVKFKFCEKICYEFTHYAFYNALKFSSKARKFKEFTLKFKIFSNQKRHKFFSKMP